MDAPFFPAIEYDAISDVISSLEPSLKEIFVQLESQDPGDVIVKALKHSDLSQMRNARMSAFRAAMDKVDHCLGQAAMLVDRDSSNIGPEHQVIKKASDLYRSLVPQDMISRRCLRNMTKDFMELLYFIAGKRVSFPITIIKTLPSPTASDNITKSALHFPFEYPANISDIFEGKEDTCDNGNKYNDDISTPSPSKTEDSSMEESNGEEDTETSEEDDISDDGYVRTHDSDRYVDIIGEIRNFMNVEEEQSMQNPSTNVAMVTVVQPGEIGKVTPRGPYDVTNPSSPGSPNGHTTLYTSMDQRNSVPISYANEVTSTETPGHEGVSPSECPHVDTTSTSVSHTALASSTHIRDSTTSTHNSEHSVLLHHPVDTNIVQNTSTVGHTSSYTSSTCHTTSFERVRQADKETHVTEKSIELEMAEGNAGSGWERWSRKRDKPKSDNRCGACSDRLDSLERHRKQAIEAEESHIEVMRNMCIQFDALSDELRRVKRRVNELSSAMPIIVDDDPTHRGRSTHSTSQPGNVVNPTPLLYPDNGPSESYAAARPRSASFNGRKSDPRSVMNGNPPDVQRRRTAPRQPDPVRSNDIADTSSSRASRYDRRAARREPVDPPPRP